MKKILYILFYVPSFLIAQENLVPIGGFENNNYSGGSDPLEYYSEVSCPEGRNDTSQVKKKSRWYQPKWHNPHWKKHNHIVDFTGWVEFIFFEPNGGALGYRYLYSTDWSWNVKFGARIGGWYRKSGQDIPANSAEKITFTLGLLLQMLLFGNFLISRRHLGLIGGLACLQKPIFCIQKTITLPFGL